MTEREWWQATEPRPMLEFLQDKVSDRKLRLFAVACCRRIWHRLEDQQYRNAVEEIEACEDRLSPPVRSPVDVGSRSNAEGITMSQLAVRFAIEALLEARWIHVPEMCARAASKGGTVLNQMNTEKTSQCSLLRDIFGTPFLPVSLDPAWLTWHDGLLDSMAQKMYDSRDFSDMPVLADALEEAGCQDPDILGHCRSGGEHVRGCWVVDALLGKE
jgi:hypothetical protein